MVFGNLVVLVRGRRGSGRGVGEALAGCSGVLGNSRVALVLSAPSPAALAPPLPPSLGWLAGRGVVYKWAAWARRARARASTRAHVSDGSPGVAPVGTRVGARRPAGRLGRVRFGLRGEGGGGERGGGGGGGGGGSDRASSIRGAGAGLATGARPFPPPSALWARARGVGVEIWAEVVAAERVAGGMGPDRGWAVAEGCGWAARPSSPSPRGEVSSPTKPWAGRPGGRRAADP